MQTTPISNRLHIGIFGKRNAGKSSLLNAVTGQSAAVTSAHPGTTTDPVYKTMELIPFGPVVWIDTAGIDDLGDLGELRVAKTKEVIRKTDLAIIVLTAAGWTSSEQQLWQELHRAGLPVIIVINQIDRFSQTRLEEIRNSLPDGLPVCPVSCLTGRGIADLKELVIATAPRKYEEPTIVGDLLTPNAVVVLVVPVDYEAPKGRLILPQVQVLRDILDHHAVGITVRETGLADLLRQIPKPRLVITDSQAFAQVNQVVPPEIALTSFSVLFARYKGDLPTFIRGADAIDGLVPGDRILIAEACTHHQVKDDIAREKLPLWLNRKIGGPLQIDYTQGQGFPENLSEYRLIIHCGACMFNRRNVLSRINEACRQNVPITNFGLAIAKLTGILARVVAPFQTKKN